MTATETGVISMDALKEATTSGTGQTHHLKLHAEHPTSTEVLTSQGQNVVATVRVKREQMSMEEINAMGLSDKSLGSATFKGEKVVTSTQNLPMNMKKVVKQVVTKVYEVQDVEEDRKTEEPRRPVKTRTETTKSGSPARIVSPADQNINLKMPQTTIMQRVSQVGIPAGIMQTGPVQVGPPIMGPIVGQRLGQRKVIGTQYRGSIDRSPSPQASPRTTINMGGTQILQPPMLAPMSPPPRQMTIHQTMQPPRTTTVVQSPTFPPPPMSVAPPMVMSPQMTISPPSVIPPQVVQQTYYEQSYTPRPMVSGQANQQIDGLVVSKLMGGQMNEQQMQQMMMQQQMQMGANQNQGFCGQCLGFIPCLSCLNSTPKQQVSLENYPRDKACGCFPRGTICCPADGGICCCPCGKSHMTPAPPIPLPPGMMAQLTAPVALSQMNQPPNPNQMQASFCSLM